MTKHVTRWHSDRLHREIGLARWGHYGQPVLLFPTAGGDAEEIERMHVIGVLSPLIEAGRIKVYSCDSIAGATLAARQGDDAHRNWILNAFHHTVAHEIVPAIHADCGGPQEIVAAGASIGAFNAVAVTCRFPQQFRAALGLSGTYDLPPLMRFQANQDYYYSSPLSFLPDLDGPALDTLRRRFVLLTFGQGRWESAAESWRMADTLGARGVPNRVDPWGPEWDHDWPTWREMLPRYLGELTA